VPIFVEVAPKQDEHLTFTFLTDGVESAIAQAKAAAGNKAVQVVGGVSAAQQLLDARLSTNFMWISQDR
jgi:dihydrofolate reductase